MSKGLHGVCEASGLPRTFFCLGFRSQDKGGLLDSSRFIPQVRDVARVRSGREKGRALASDTVPPVCGPAGRSTFVLLGVPIRLPADQMRFGRGSGEGLLLSSQELCRHAAAGFRGIKESAGLPCSRAGRCFP